MSQQVDSPVLEGIPGSLDILATAALSITSQELIDDVVKFFDNTQDCLEKVRYYSSMSGSQEIKSSNQSCQPSLSADFDNSQDCLDKVPYYSFMSGSQKIRSSNQSCQPSLSADFDINTLDENSSDHHLVSISSSPEIITNAKKLSVDDYYKKSKKEKRIARKQIVNSTKLDKRERNRIAAKKLRLKRKEEKEKIKNLIKHWENEVSILKKRYNQLSAQKNHYLDLLQNLKLDDKAKEEVELSIRYLNQTD